MAGFSDSENQTGEKMSDKEYIEALDGLSILHFSKKRAKCKLCGETYEKKPNRCKACHKASCEGTKQFVEAQLAAIALDFKRSLWHEKLNWKEKEARWMDFFAVNGWGYGKRKH